MTTTLDRPAVPHTAGAAMPGAAGGDGGRALRRIGLARARRAARRDLRADILAVLCCTSVAIAVALSLATGGLDDLGSLGALLTEAGVLAGLVTTDLVLVMLVLAARIPLVDGTFGRDATMALHRRLGKPVLYLLLAHGGLLILGYGLADGLGPVGEALALLSIPDLLLAVLALGLFVVVVVSSLVVVRRKFPYEAWHVVHLLSYAAVLVALPHQLSVGGVLADDTWERTYWIALYALAVGSIGWFRFVVPTLATLRHDVRVERVDEVAPGVVSIHLTGRRLDRLRLRGGQYAI